MASTFPCPLDPSPSTLFGLTTHFTEAQVHILPVPWEVTTSYGSGASLGPAAILKASSQLDLYDAFFGMVHKHSLYLAPISKEMLHFQGELKKQAQKIGALYNEDQTEPTPVSSLELRNDLEAINKASEHMVQWVYDHTLMALENHKLPGLLGGDHSTPLGAIKALSEKHKTTPFGVLHIDAHADLRQAYQGFTHSHASIMYNVLQLPHPPTSLVQVGIRDVCKEEVNRQKDHSSVHCFYDHNLKSQLFSGKTWDLICNDIIEKLPELVYISFDIDGLNPSLCPNTGTPVPGGLEYCEAIYLLQKLVLSKRKIIGFDLCEVAPNTATPLNEWDGNVGARILYQLCGISLATRNILQGSYPIIQ